MGNLPEDGDGEGLGQRKDLPDARQGPAMVRKHDQESKRRQLVLSRNYFGKPKQYPS